MKSRESKEKDALGFLVFALFVYTLFTHFYSTLSMVYYTQSVFESIMCLPLFCLTERIIQWSPMVPEALLNNGKAIRLESIIAVL